jgi:hypothetical protein
MICVLELLVSVLAEQPLEARWRETWMKVSLRDQLRDGGMALVHHLD